MKPLLAKSLLPVFWSALIILIGRPIPGARAQGPDTVQHTIHSHFWGDRTYTSLVIDGGIVPLVVPPGSDTQVRGGNGVTITWPGDDAIARIRRASRGEAALVDLMGKPEASEAWKKYIPSTLHGPGYKVDVHDFQPDVLDVNHWRIGAITMDYSVGARKSSSLVMLWRCKDGSTIAVTLASDTDHFKSHCDELFTMIGGSLLIAP